MSRRFRYINRDAIIDYLVDADQTIAWLAERAGVSSHTMYHCLAISKKKRRPVGRQVRRKLLLTLRRHGFSRTDLFLKAEFSTSAYDI